MGWALINVLGFQGGRLFKVGAYSNKYGKRSTFQTLDWNITGLTSATTTVSFLW